MTTRVTFWVAAYASLVATVSFVWSLSRALRPPPQGWVEWGAFLFAVLASLAALVVLVLAARCVALEGWGCLV